MIKRLLILWIALGGSLTAQVGRYQLQQIVIPYLHLQSGTESDGVINKNDTLSVLLDTKEGRIYQLYHDITIIQGDSIRYSSIYGKDEIFTGRGRYYSLPIDGNFPPEVVVQILNAYQGASRKVSASIRIQLQENPYYLYYLNSDSIEFVDGKYQLKNQNQ